MRYPAAVTAQRHEQIVAAAARLLRRDGIDGVSVAEVMKAAGLTHGGFYAHFDSKEAMAAAAVQRAMAETLESVDRAADTAEPLAAFATEYLSVAHRDHPEQGCAMAALAPEIARRHGPVRETFTTWVKALIDRITRTVRTPAGADSRPDAITAVCTLVGALILARAVDDPALSTEILNTTSAHYADLTSRQSPPPRS